MRSLHAVLAAWLLGTALPTAAIQLQAPGAEALPPPRGNPLFASMSPTGRAIMRAAMRSGELPAAQVATDTARDRWLAVLDADRLDPVALKRGMDDERDAANAAKMRRQAAMLAGFEQLSLADRRAYAAEARAMRARIEARAAEMKARRRGPGEFTQPR